MSKLIEKHRKLLGGGALLVGCMALSEATFYAYNSFSLDLREQPLCVGRPCDAEDPDDCGDECQCVDAYKLCGWDGPPL